MRKKDRADILWPDARLMQAAFQLPQREAIIYQNGRCVVLHQDSISVAAAAK